MDFASIGNVRTWARMSNLKFAANHRLKTGQSLVGSNGQLNFSTLGRSTFVDQMMKSQKQSGDEISKKRLAAIKRKLMSGKKLSNEEMGYLMRHDSKLYNKAKRVEEAREELKSDLRQAKSKAEARKALTRAIMKASAECTAELDAAQKAGGGMSVGGFDGGSIGLDGGSIGLDGGSVSFDQGMSDQSFSDQNISVGIDAKAEGDTPSTENNLSTQGTSSDEKPTKDDILEKYIMIIRALEDEWRTFTKSKQYKALPDELDDEVKLDARRDNAISKYRAAMSLSMIKH